MSVQEFNSLSSKVYNALQIKILSGEYINGESLIETKLSEEYGISRTPVREALHRLELEGLVSLTNGRGVVVTALSEQDITDIYTIRMKIEGLSARWAAQKIEPQELAGLKESVDLLEFYLNKDNYTALGELDTRFHEIIYQACKSRPLQSTLATFHNYIRRARNISYNTKDRPRQVLAEHSAIYHAIESKNADLAETLACEHVKKAAENYKSKLRGG